MDPLLGTHILQSSAEWSLRPEKPLLMRIGMGVSVFIAALCLLFSLLVLVGGLSPIFASQHLAREYFGSLAILGIFWGGMLLAIAYGFWKEKPWSRHLVIGYWLIAYLSVLVRLWMYGDTLQPILMAEFVPHTIFLAIATWYFYLKPNVVDYYLTLDWWYPTEVTEAPRTEVLAEEPATAQVVAEGESIEVVTEVPRTEEESSSLSTLADVSRAEGRFAEAERLYKRALAIDEEALEKDHLNVARDVNNLAKLYQAQGQYAEAEPLYRRGLAMREKDLGPVHPEVAQSLNNLAAVYRDQGRYGAAEPFCKRALEIWQKVLGPVHPEVASSLSTLADLSRGKGRFAEAERLYKRALAIDEEALGKDHLNVARDVNNLALFYDSRGNDAEAEPLYHRALAIAKKALGPDHPEVATVAANVKGFYEKTGRKVEPEKLKERATEHQAILKLVGVVLIGVGLMDVGYMFYSIYAGKTYASIFSIIAIIAGAFLLNGSLRAARIVATSAAFFVAGLSGVIIALPILLPVDLILTYLKFAPLSDVLLATPFLLAYGLSVWVYHNLTSQPVKAGMDEAGMNYKSFWKSPALGLKIGAVFIVILIVSLVFFLKGEKADRAVEEARKKMGSRYKYQVVSMRTSSSKEATMVQAEIIAYDATSIRYVDVAWKEPDARQTKTKGKGSKKKSRRRK
ncbi:MAG: tetratricopeptide repeat protein [Candidatus Methylomirabilales bacterium]|nr:tetratricopeptide repeat protein [candidate division NC10 bacterium]